MAASITMTRPAFALPGSGTGAPPASAKRLPPVFWALCAGAGLARLGWLLIPFRTIYLTQERQLTPPQAALVMAAFGAGWALALPIGGGLADRIGRRTVIAGGAVANAAACLLFGAATTVSWLVLTGFLAGMTFDLFRPAAQALAADTAGEHRLSRAIALLFWVMNVARCVACFAGGLLAQHHVPLLFAACAAVSLLFAVFMRATLPAGRPPAGRDSGGWRTSMRDKRLIWFTAATAGFFTIYMQSVVTLPAGLAQRGITPLQLGMILSASPLLVALAQPLYLNRLHRLPPKTVAAAGLAATGAGLALTGTATNVAWAVAFTPIWVAGDIVFLAVAAGLVASMAPTTRRGTYLGIWASAHGIGALAAPPLAAAAIAAGGPSLLWTSCAAGGLLLSVLVLRLNLTHPPASGTAQSQPNMTTTRPDRSQVLVPAHARWAFIPHAGRPPTPTSRINAGPRLTKPNHSPRRRRCPRPETARGNAAQRSIRGAPIRRSPAAFWPRGPTTSGRAQPANWSKTLLHGR